MRILLSSLAQPAYEPLGLVLFWQLYTPWQVPDYLRPYYTGQQRCNLTTPAALKLYMDAAGVWSDCAASDPTFAGSPHCPLCTASIYQAAIMVRSITRL